MSEIIDDEEEDKENPVQFRIVLTGYSYQLKLLLLFLCRGLRNGYIFKLQTEIEAAEKFDDLIFYYKKHGESKFSAICLQAKHSTFKEAELEYSSFINDCKKKVCNLKKYFVSFQNIKRNFSAAERPEKYILCNNYFLPSVLKRNEMDKFEDALVFEKINPLGDIFHDTVEVWPQYKLSQANQELIDWLKNETNISSLATKMLNLIMKLKDGENVVEIDLNGYYFSVYKEALFNDGILEVQDFVIFKQSFIDGNNSTTKPYTESLRKLFITEFMKVYSELKELKYIRLSEAFLDIYKESKAAAKDYTEKELQIFVTDLMECIIDRRSKKVVSLITKYSTCLKDIIQYQKRIVFSDKFLNNNITNPNIKRFREIIFKYYTKHLIKNISNITIHLEREGASFETSSFAANENNRGEESASKCNEGTLGETAATENLKSTDNAEVKNHKNLNKIDEKTLAKIFFYKNRISPNVVTELQQEFKETILQYSGENSIKFADKVLTTPEKKEKLHNFMQIFLEQYAIETLKTKSFSFIPPKNEDINKVANKILQDGEFFELDKMNRHFTEVLFEYAFEFVPNAENVFKFRPSFFETKAEELPDEIRVFQETINEKLLELAYETLQLSEIKIEDSDEEVLALPENNQKKRNIFAKFADEFIELHFGQSSSNLNNLYTYNWKTYGNKETKGYINAFKDEIFNVSAENKSLTLKKGFFVNKGLSSNAKLFQQQLTDKLKKKFHDIFVTKQFNIKQNCFPLYCKIESMEKLAQTIVEAQNANDHPNFVDETKQLIFDLAGMVFVSTVVTNKVKFSKSFIIDNEWSREAEYFKKALKEKLQVREFNNLKNWTITIDKTKLQSKSHITYFEAQLFADDIKNALKNPKANENYIPKKPDFHTMAHIFKGTVFEESESCENELYFKNSFFDEHKWSKSAKIFGDCLKKYLPDGSFSSFEDFEMEVEGFPFCCDTMIEDGNIMDNINEFLQNLLIITTPGDNTLLEVVDKELGNEFQLLNTNAFTAELFTKIIEWSKLVDGKALTEIEAKSFFDGIKSNISSIMSSGINSLYCEQLNRKRIFFKQINANWKTFLENDCNQKQFLFLKSNLTKLTEVKVLQILKNISTHAALDSMIFQNLSSLLLMEKFILQKTPHETLTSALSSNLSQNLIVIVDDAIAQNVWHFYDFLKTINYIISENPQKKLILITHERSEILKIMKKQVLPEKILEEKDFIQFQDLTKKTKKRLLKKKVCFQGRMIPLYKVINSHKLCDNFMDDETIKKLVENKRLSIALPLDSFKGIDSKYYYKRQIGFLKADRKLLEIIERMKKHIFVFNGMNAFNLRELLQLHGIDTSKVCSAADFIKSSFNPVWRYIAFDKSSEKEIGEYLKQLKFKYPKMRVHSFLIVDTKTKNKMYVDEKFFAQYISNENVTVITDSAGMGKTTILTKLEHEFKEINPQKWIIRINLSHYTSFFLKLKKNEKYPDNDDDHFVFNFENSNNNYGEIILNALRKTKKIVEAAKTFENHIFEYLFKIGKVLIIFDGFDEIGADYRKILLTWILRLKNRSKNHVWISSRTTFLSNLEASLETKGYSLKPLTENEQEKMLFNVWRNKWKGNSLTKSQEFHILQYVKSLIFDFSKSLKTTQNIIGRPLHTMMLAKMFKSNTEIDKSTNDDETKWVGCYDYVRYTSSCKKENCSILNECFHLFNTGPLKDLFNLYDKFVEKKIIKYFVEGKNIIASVQEAALKMKKQIFFDYHHLHRIFGLFAMTETASELIDEEEKEKIKTFTAEFKLGDYNAGLLDDIIEERCQPIFVHLTYAEYFCAYFLIKKLNSAPDKKSVIFNIIGEILQCNAPVFSYCIKHLMIHKCENYDIENLLKDINVTNFASTLEHYNCVKWLLSDDGNFEFKFAKADSSSKTHLHYAVECGNLQIIVYILLHTFTLIMKNDLQRQQSILFETSLPFEAKTTAMFFLSEYINLKDSEGNTALDYSKDTNITALLIDLVTVGQKQKTSDIYNDEIIKILNEISKMFAENDLSEILNGTVQSFNYFTTFFRKLSIPSIMIVLDNVESSFLEFLFKDDEDGFNFLAAHFARSDLTTLEKEKILECKWETDNIPKPIIFVRFIAATISVESIDDFKALQETAENSKIIFPVDGSFALACQYGTYEILKLLLPAVTNDMKIDNLTPFCYALKCGAPLHMIDLIYHQTKPDINERVGRGDTALMLAIFSSFKLPIIRYLLQNDADPNIAGPEKYNKQDFINNFAEFLKPVPMINLPGRAQTPWQCALIKKDDEIIKCFLENSEIKDSDIFLETIRSFYNEPNFDINFKSDNTPRLIEAIYLNDKHLIKFLLWKKADVNIEDKITGKVPLHYACEKNLDKLVKKLLKHGAYFDIKDNEGKLPIDYCEENSEAKERLKFTSMIFEKAEKYEEGKTFNEPNILKPCYFSLSLTNKKKQTLMHLFAKCGYFFKFKKEDIPISNKQDFLENTALHYAAENGHIQIVTSLLLNYSFYDIKNMDHKTPQMLAKENGHENISNLLEKLDEMFDAASEGDVHLFTNTFEAFNNNSNNAFHEFKIHLLRNKEGHALLFKAIASKSIDIVRILLKYLYIPDIEDQDLLLPAIKNNDLIMIKLLLKHKIPFNNKRWNNFKKNSIKNECVLLFDKVDFLFECIYNENYESLKELFQSFNEDEISIAEIANMTDQKEKSIFEYIQETTNYDLIYYLRKNGATYKNINLSKNKKVRKILLDTRTTNDYVPAPTQKFMDFFKKFGGAEILKNQITDTFKSIVGREDIFGEDVEMKKLIHMTSFT